MNRIRISHTHAQLQNMHSHRHPCCWQSAPLKLQAGCRRRRCGMHRKKAADAHGSTHPFEPLDHAVYWCGAHCPAIRATSRVRTRALFSPTARFRAHSAATGCAAAADAAACRPTRRAMRATSCCFPARTFAGSVCADGLCWRRRRWRMPPHPARNVPCVLLPRECALASHTHSFPGSVRADGLPRRRRRRSMPAHPARDARDTLLLPRFPAFPGSVCADGLCRRRRRRSRHWSGPPHPARDSQHVPPYSVRADGLLRRWCGCRRVPPHPPRDARDVPSVQRRPQRRRELLHLASCDAYAPHDLRAAPAQAHQTVDPGAY